MIIAVLSITPLIYEGLPMQVPLQARNDSDTAQTDVAKIVAQERTLTDNRPEAVTQRKLVEMMDNSPGMLQQRALSNAIHNHPGMVAQRHEMNVMFGGAVQAQRDGAMSAEASPVRHEEKLNNTGLSNQLKAGTESLPSMRTTSQSELSDQRAVSSQLSQLQATANASTRVSDLQAIQRMADRTGLPGRLKDGVERLSGMSMDEVRVHYNSDKPAQLNAHAYAQGTDIHVGPGQEKHLPHEAWHVVQQKQGRVKPTMQLRGKLNVNDDVDLEKEADAMGATALQEKGAAYDKPLQRALYGIKTKQLNTRSGIFQLAERTTSIHKRVPNTTMFHKGMEIVDSTSPDTYVHISRNAEANENDVDIQQQPNYFNGLAEPAKRSRVDEQPGHNPHVNLSRYTRANNAHITLEGRYARIMQTLAIGFADLDGIKGGAPVDADFNNLNFGSYADHGNSQASDYGIYTYIHKWADDAEDYARQREENFDGENEELVQTIQRVHDKTSDFTTRLITGSPLNNLQSEDFVHYGGEEWSPVLPGELLNLAN